MGARLVALLILLLAVALVPGASEARKSVLLLFDEDKDFPGLALLNRTLRDALGSELGGDLELYSEELNVSQFRDDSQDRLLSDFFRQKYAGKRLDLLVAVMGPSLDFLLRHGATVFPGTPIVFCGADASDLDGKSLPAHVTGVVVKREFAATLEIALRLQPGTRTVFVVGGTSPFDRRLQAIAQRQFAPFASRLQLTSLTALSMDDVLKAVSSAPRDSVILYLSLFADGAGRSYVPHDALALIAKAAAVPVYVSVDQYLDRGAVGGHVYSVDTHGRQAAELGLRILRGEAPASLPVREIASHANVFDARQLARWGLDERRLPPGSEVRFREFSVWDRYKWYVAGGAVLLVAQTGLIAGLLVSRAQRRRAQHALAERLRFETLLSELSTTLITLPVSEVDRAIERMLRRVGEALDLDRAVVAERDPAGLDIRTTHAWTRTGVAPAPGAFQPESFPWTGARLLAGDVVRFSRPDELPDEAITDRRSLAALGVRSLAAVPLVVEGSVVGAVGFSVLRAEMAWPDEFVARLQLLAEIFANVLARRRAETAVQASEARRQQAEEAAQRQREELAHALRVATLGELTASFAHEVSQPLSAIASNAHAARRFLDLESTKPEEIRDALVDIAADAQRAGQVIGRLRALFRKEHTQAVAIDVNALLRDVVGLLRTNLQHRNIVVRFGLAAALPPVLGDTIQIQQVVLNLIVNACEAMGDTRGGPRAIVIATSQPDPKHLAITVRDSGDGVDESQLERIFDHFVTSKPQGLGMGLAISRSIVEAHGGRIWATRNDEGGLTLHVRLPVQAARA